jgi:hypothetical protein
MAGIAYLTPSTDDPSEPFMNTYNLNLASRPIITDPPQPNPPPNAPPNDPPGLPPGPQPQPATKRKPPKN